MSAQGNYPNQSFGGGSASGVASINSETGAVVLVQGSGVTITPAGQNITIAATAAQPQPPIPTFYINKNGSNYQCINALGAVVSSNTDAAVCINYALANGASGVFIFVAPHTSYNQATAIGIVGAASGAFFNGTPATEVFLWGGGYSAIFVPAAGVNSIELSNNAIVNIQNFSIHLPTASSGNGIIGLDTGTSGISITDSYFDNICIYGGDSTHACLWIKNPTSSSFGYIFVQSITGSGVIFDETVTRGVNICGNTSFKHLVGQITGSISTYVLTIQALVNQAAINLIDFFHIDIYAGGGIHLQAKNGGLVGNCGFNGGDLEATGKQVFIDVDGSSQISNHTFNFNYMSVNAGQIAIDESAANGNHWGNVYNVVVLSDGSSVILNDGSSYPQLANTYNFRASGVAPSLTSGQIVIGGGASPVISWNITNAGYSPQLNPNSGIAAGITTGTAIAHNLGITPNFHMAVGQSFPVTWVVSATTITPTWTGGAQNVAWRVGFFNG